MTQIRNRDLLEMVGTPEPETCRYCGCEYYPDDDHETDGYCDWYCYRDGLEEEARKYRRLYEGLRKVAVEVADEVYAAQERIMTLLPDVTPETREIARTCGAISYFARELMQRAGYVTGAPHAGEA